MLDFLDKLSVQQTSWEPLPEDSDLEQFFTDAEYAHQVFEELVTEDRLPKRLLVIHGVGGVGKSTLLRMYRLSCYRRGIPVALVGAEDAPSSVDVLASWAEDLSNTGVRLRSFPKSLDHYRALQSNVEAKAEKAKEAMRGAAGKLGKAVAKTAVEMVASTIPVIGPLAVALGGTGTEAAIDWLRGFLSKPDLEFYLDPSKRLTDDFLNDLTRAATRQRIVLMADTYEQMAALDDWMRGLTQQLPENVLLIIAGRGMPEWDRAWLGWMGQAQVILLKEMTPEDQRALVRRYYAYIRGGEPDPEQVEAIVEFARGLPIAATTVVRLWVKHGVEDLHMVKAQVVADLADRLLEGVSPEMRPVFEAVAVLRHFNADSLRALVDDGDADALYSELGRWPFIHPRREGLAVHDTMREMMNEALAVRSPERFRTLHERAASYHEARQAETSGEERESATLESLYHTLRADESKGVALLERLFHETERLWQKEPQRKLLKEASEYAFRKPQHRYRLQYLQAQMGKDWPERERLYRVLLIKNLNDTLRPAVLRGLGEALSFQHRPDEARGYLQQALEICERLGDPIETAWTRLELSWRTEDPEEFRQLVDFALESFREAGDEYGQAVAELEWGYYYLNRWQATQAREAFARSLALHERLGHRRDAAMAQERIGQAYLIEGDFPRAVACKEQALQLFEKLKDEWGIAWTLDELATCYIWTGQWELGVAASERARQIFAKWGDHRETASVARQGEFFRRQDRFDRALETYQRASGMPEHNVWSTYDIHAGRGHVYLARGEFEKARKGFQRATDAFREKGKGFEAKLVGSYDLGSLYLAQGRWDEAIEQFTVCLDTAQSRGHHAFECLSLVRMCQVHYQQGHPEQVEALAGEAEKLAQAYGYDKQLAEIYLLRGHIALDESLAGQAILEPAIRFYRTAMKHTLRYNRYELDETLAEIIAHCQERDDEGLQVLIDLLDFWRIGTDDQGVSLLDAERAAREREPGDGSPQKTVVEQIEATLTTTYGG